METYTISGRKYTLEEIAACGDSHGRGGIVYYPPSVWGTGGGWGSTDTKPPDPQTLLDRTYAAAYAQGRDHAGCPDSGCPWWDEREPGEGVPTFGTSA